MLRVVVDTSVIVAAFRSRSGASAALLDMIVAREVVPVLSPALLLEYEDVLKRPQQRAVHGLPIDGIDAFLQLLSDICDPVDIAFSWRPQLRDPGDELVLEAAVNGRCPIIITHNIRDFGGAEKRFGLRIVSPALFLKEVVR